MSEDTPVLFVKHSGEHSHRATRRAVTAYQFLLKEHPAIHTALVRNQLPVYISILSDSIFELETLSTLKDVGYGGVFIHLDYVPNERWVFGTNGVSKKVTDPALLYFIPEIVRIAKESKWGFVVITGCTDDAARDHVDYCYAVTDVEDFSNGYKQLLNVECYRKRATLR